MSGPIFTPRYRVVVISKAAAESYDMYMIVNRRGENVGEYYTKGVADEVATELNNDEAE